MRTMWSTQPKQSLDERVQYIDMPNGFIRGLRSCVWTMVQFQESRVLLKPSRTGASFEQAFNECDPRDQVPSSSLDSIQSGAGVTAISNTSSKTRFDAPSGLLRRRSRTPCVQGWTKHKIRTGHHRCAFPVFPSGAMVARDRGRFWEGTR